MTMGIKYRAAAEFTEAPNGSRCFRTPDPFASVAKVENCPCEDGVRRNAFATAEPDTFFSIPACVYVSPSPRMGRREAGAQTKTVGGFLSSDDDGWKFTAYSHGKNADLIKGLRSRNEQEVKCKQAI
jgi:hypothetical protein